MEMTADCHAARSGGGGLAPPAPATAWTAPAGDWGTNRGRASQSITAIMRDAASSLSLMNCGPGISAFSRRQSATQARNSMIWSRPCSAGRLPSGGARRKPAAHVAGSLSALNEAGRGEQPVSAFQFRHRADWRRRLRNTDVVVVKRGRRLAAPVALSWRRNALCREPYAVVALGELPASAGV
jgi:hypothetical protein